MYTAFATVYDRLMSDVPYQAWADFYHEMLSGMGIADGSRVVECACGTGGLTVPLARWYQMTGVDCSQDMLSRAALKARGAGRDIRFVHQDMRALQVHRPVDAVLCTCDGLNYLTEPGGAARFLAAARRALRPGGALAFDVSAAHKLRHTLGTGVRTLVEPDVCYIWRSRWQEEKRLLRMDLTVFSLRLDGAWDRIEETQEQRAFEQAELQAMLADAGFEEIAWRGDRRHAQPAADEPRLHACARRPA